MEIWVWWIVGFGIFLFFGVILCLYFWYYTNHKELKKKQTKSDQEKNKQTSLPKVSSITKKKENHSPIYSLPLPPSTLRYSLSSRDNLSDHTAIEIDPHPHLNQPHSNHPIEEDQFITQLSAPPVRFFLHQQRWDNNIKDNKNKNEPTNTLNEQEDNVIHDPSTIDRNLSLSPFLGITHIPSPSKSISIHTNSPSPNSKAKSSWNWKRY
ncbi:unnamed protein product [Cunninghamella blakesleeana]